MMVRGSLLLMFTHSQKSADRRALDTTVTASISVCDSTCKGSDTFSSGFIRIPNCSAEANRLRFNDQLEGQN
jgi:hypothetical protein